MAKKAKGSERPPVAIVIMLAIVIEEMECDPETYLVSAEAHNLWRGAVPYDSYPMRRIGSVSGSGWLRYFSNFARA
jgi:hypothetical protein